MGLQTRRRHNEHFGTSTISCTKSPLQKRKISSYTFTKADILLVDDSLSITAKGNVEGSKKNLHPEKSPLTFNHEVFASPHLRDVVVQLVQRIKQRSQMGLQQNQASSFDLNLQVQKVGWWIFVHLHSVKWRFSNKPSDGSDFFVKKTKGYHEIGIPGHLTWINFKKQHVIFKWHGKKTPFFVCLGVQNLTKRFQVCFGCVL